MGTPTSGQKLSSSSSTAAANDLFSKFMNEKVVSLTIISEVDEDICEVLITFEKDLASVYIKKSFLNTMSLYYAQSRSMLDLIVLKFFTNTK